MAVPLDFDAVHAFSLPLIHLADSILNVPQNAHTHSLPFLDHRIYVHLFNIYSTDAD